MRNVASATRSIVSGSASSSAAARIAWRTFPIVTAASRPLPITSPTESAMRPSGSANASYQSPPISASRLPGTYTASNRNASHTGSARGSDAACKRVATRRSCS